MEINSDIKKVRIAGQALKAMPRVVLCCARKIGHGVCCDSHRTSLDYTSSTEAWGGSDAKTREEGFKVRLHGENGDNRLTVEVTGDQIQAMVQRQK